ncbi:hypothetical protein K431DRAFT_314290 [Polychaeton citri CBS 116435]|uniref:Exocyst complex component Sec3 PIP2-binding N-terminal domain-containing protein n=1 Tax=Polychaeton citri CBS 116435 TaxID=1314669 RepID=A0A9P4UNA0_9PEZI|nr:hypothetical protein K431DRAFT_314290 [Polychaeton citri CBS 116435]
MSRPPPPNGYPAPAAGPPRTGVMSRAERFEDEKRRIIESCFSKVDANGQLSESYITHIRINEDGQHPSSPPPPESGPENKKPRLIIVAVRSTGRVRMHKARENNNGSFSIGKTWNMEELSAIETFSGVGMPPATNEKEQRFREWAGNIGFTVTVTKPYYWQAGTSKEKDFFIASCVKIYRKYTKGLVPELRGFGEQEKAMLLGAAAGGQGEKKQLGGPSSSSAAGGTTELPPPYAPFAREGTSSREASPFRGSPGPPPSIGDQRRPSDSPARASRGPPSGGFGPAPPAPRPFASQEQMRTPPTTHLARDTAPASLRPGTSPGPRPPPQNRGPPPPVFARDASPSVTSIASSHHSSDMRGPNPSQRPYQRQPSYPDPQQAVPQGLNGDISSPTTASAFHASLYGQQRSGDLYQQPPPSQTSPQQPRMEAHQPRFQQSTSRSATPQLPPIETDHPWPVGKGEHGTPKPGTAGESEASSAAIDLNDATAIGALTGFWGPETNNSNSQPVPKLEEQVSPPTPERSSKRRPFAEERTRTSDTSDLRPPPLGAARARSPNEEHSRQVTPLAAADQLSPGLTSPALSSESAQPTPRQEQFEFEDNAPKPLFQRRQQDEVGSNPHLPGAFATPTFGESPVTTPTNDHVRPLAPQSRPRSPPVESEIRPLTPSSAKLREVKAADRPNEPTEDTRAVESAVEEVRTPESLPATPPGEQYRPGLGPMIRKGTAAERFRTAARAANAFKPRPGGAAEKILKAKADREGYGEADGISGVFKPKPKTEESSRDVSEEHLPKVAPLERQNTDLSVKSPVSSMTDTPSVQVHSPVSPIKDENSLAALEGSGHPEGVQLSDQQNGALQPNHSPDADDQGDRLEQRALRTPHGKIKRRSFQQERYLAELGIDRSLLEGKGIDFEILLGDFGWGANASKPKNVHELETDIKREVGRMEAGAWLSQSDTHREEKVAQVDSLLERCIAECDELEGLLTLYSVELGTLNEDIAFIEAQSQGLQVQSANQKLLQTELSSLLETMTLDRRILDSLRFGDLNDERSLEIVERSLVKLYQAMITMDPSIRTGGLMDGRPGSKGGVFNADSELAQMKALREKRAVYQRECGAFCDRLAQHLDFIFTTSLNSARDRALRPASSGGASNGVGGLKKLDKTAFANARAACWMFSPLILFTKEINTPSWGLLLQTYQQRARPLYEGVFKENIAGWKRSVRRTTGEESEILFTHQEKENTEVNGGSSGLSSTARKLTVKRSQTLAKSLRQASGGEKYGVDNSRSPGAMMSSVVFASAMDEMAPLISQEQNFVVDLFHATSLETFDFPDAVSALLPEGRRGTNLLAGRHVEPDREIALQVTNAMEEIFGFFASEVGQLLDWALGTDPLQGVGIMASLSKHAYYLQEHNQSQEWLTQMIDGSATRLQTLFSKFVEEQIRAIEDTKVKIKKRKGVIGFMKTFPHFSAAIENILAAVARDDYEKNHPSIGDVRRLIDDAYARLNRAMFDSLKVIAKESPGAQQSGAVPGAQRTGQSDDPEDKEMLNYQILIIENMNHYIEEVDDGGRQGSVLAEWRGRAQQERREALDAYVSRVIRRPLGKILDWLDTTDSLLRTSSSDMPLASRQNYSRKAVRNLLSQYDGKEIRRGIDTLRKRIEKHFGDADEESISRNLVGLVCKECETAYEKTLDRLETLRRENYPSAEGEKSVEIGFEKADVQAGFRR